MAQGRACFAMLGAMPAGGFALRSASRALAEASYRLRPMAAAWRVRGPYLVGVAALASAYYAAAELGYAFDFSGPVAAIVWLPVGVGVSFLYLAGVGFWPGVVAGDLLANDYSTLPLGTALAQTCGNVLEVVVATLLLRRLVPRGSPLETVDGLLRLLAALGLGTVVSATIGALALRLGDVASTAALPTIWRTWWLGDFTGALIVVPLAIAWHPLRTKTRPPGRAAEAALLAAAIVGVGVLALSGPRPAAYLLFPTLVWAALRFERRGATLAVASAAALTLWQTIHHDGPFAFRSITSGILGAQLYLTAAALSALSLAAVVSEREALARELRSLRARLVEAAASERRRIEHNLHDGAQQRLSALAVRLALAADRVSEAPERAAESLAQASSELGLAIEELRELAHGIHPPVLTELGLEGAVKDLAERSTVPIRPLQVPSARLDPAVEATAYYLIAEAVANAERHARASAICVRAWIAPRLLRVEVSDDGVGGATESSGYGLQGLRDRVEAHGGTLEIESPAGGGTRIAAAIPAPGLRRSGW